MSILLWGPATDPPLQSVHRELLQLGVPVLLADQELVAQTRFQWHTENTIQGLLEVGTQVINLAEVKAVYLRSHDASQLAAVTAQGKMMQGGTNLTRDHATALNQAVLAWADLAPALVLNRPSAMTANHSKPYQLGQIRRSGFRVPQTLITTDPEAAIAFWQQHGEVIYKSISGIRSRVSRLSKAHWQRLDHIHWCPTQFQEYIPGNDYRVHVVGDRVFACEIVSGADDYRYAASPGEAPVLRPVELPSDVQRQCQALSSDLKLPVAGIDLRQTPDGEWVCFEVNPSPGFTYFEQETGHGISAAIAQLLASEMSSSRSSSRSSSSDSVLAPSAQLTVPEIEQSVSSAQLTAPEIDSSAPLSPSSYPSSSYPVSSYPPAMPASIHPPLKFQPLSHSWVALHPRPRGVVQFIGGAFFGTFPTLFYRHFLRELYEQGFTIVAFPFRFSFRHWSMAGSLFNEQSRLRSLLTQEARRLNYEAEIYEDAQQYSWIGHSLGCKYIALLELLSDPEWKTLLQTTLGAEVQEQIERSLGAFGQGISIKGQPSLLLAPAISDTKSAIPLPWLAAQLDNLKLGVLPTRQQTQSLIQKSQLFNLTALISFECDRVAGSQTNPDLSKKYGNCNDVIWFVEQLRQKRFSVLTEEFPGKHLEPLGFSFKNFTWNPFGHQKVRLKQRFLEQATYGFLKDLYERAGTRTDSSDRLTLEAKVTD
ncbi:DUF1350 family protein [Leptolyngbya ohadii]|uniref:DUF1350 family protein n=1 Tax=Leptolyngbya ohadii TaxID=1962290 RepID=UPI000B59B6FF|nr:DUF1350 family protein [Leptolyngbya ohadii]